MKFKARFGISAKNCTRQPIFSRTSFLVLLDHVAGFAGLDLLHVAREHAGVQHGPIWAIFFFPWTVLMRQIHLAYFQPCKINISFRRRDFERRFRYAQLFYVTTDRLDSYAIQKSIKFTLKWVQTARCTMPRSRDIDDLRFRPPARPNRTSSDQVEYSSFL